MAKQDLGHKHICTECGAKFYDLTCFPPTCPVCKTIVEVAERPRPKRPVPKAVVAAAGPGSDGSRLDADTAGSATDEDEVEDDSEDVIEDASVLGDDEAVVGVLGKPDEDS